MADKFNPDAFTSAPTCISGNPDCALVYADNLTDALKPLFFLPYHRYITADKKDIFLIKNTKGQPLPDGCSPAACISVFTGDPLVKKAIVEDIAHIHRIDEKEHFMLIVRKDDFVPSLRRAHDHMAPHI